MESFKRQYDTTRQEDLSTAGAGSNLASKRAVAGDVLGFRGVSLNPRGSP
jgi:hypothetical protein